MTCKTGQGERKGERSDLLFVTWDPDRWCHGPELTSPKYPENCHAGEMKRLKLRGLVITTRFIRECESALAGVRP